MLADEASLITAARLRPQLAERYLALEQYVGHTFNAGSMARIVERPAPLARCRCAPTARRSKAGCGLVACDGSGRATPCPGGRALARRPSCPRSRLTWVNAEKFLDA